MSRQVYIGKVRSAEFDYYKKFLPNECSHLPERISDERPNFALWNSIYHDAYDDNVTNAKNAGYELNVIKFSKADMISYLRDPKFIQCPGCFAYVGKETYEKYSTEEIEYLISVANNLADDEEYLLVAYEATSLEEYETEEVFD